MTRNGAPRGAVPISRYVTESTCSNGLCKPRISLVTVGRNPIFGQAANGIVRTDGQYAFARNGYSLGDGEIRIDRQDLAVDQHAVRNGLSVCWAQYRRCGHETCEYREPPRS